jgi:hypothetical protein
MDVYQLVRVPLLDSGHSFLQRVGGRYRFMHKLLQEYFAKMDLN